jgi:hypothetical protein
VVFVCANPINWNFCRYTMKIKCFSVLLRWTCVERLCCSPLFFLICSLTRISARWKFLCFWIGKSTDGSNLHDIINTLNFLRMMKSIQHAQNIVNSDFGDYGFDSEENGIGKLSSVSNDEDSCVRVIICNMRYYQCCCCFKSVVFKLPVLTNRNNSSRISMISLWDRDAEAPELRNVMRSHQFSCIYL